MENSRKSNSADLARRLAGRLAALIPPHRSVLVAFSGGLDSVVLLHILKQLSARHAWQLSALHVHHGISPHADAWAAFCEQRCLAYNITFHLEQVDIGPLREQGVEAAARQLRYAAYAKYRQDFLALAHHADDQAETLLLQLLRGAGVRGASAMPMLASRDTLWVRPLLDVTRAEIQDYADQHRLSWVEDESNADEGYPRNFLRRQALPLLAQRFPAYRTTLARSAQHFHEASLLLDELAQQDAGAAMRAECLEVAALQALGEARAKNLLRYFLQLRGAAMPQAAQLEDMVQQLCRARDDAVVCVNYSTWQVRRYRDLVHVMPLLPVPDKSIRQENAALSDMDWAALRARIVFSRVRGTGISLDKLRSAPVTLRLRQGGESLRPQVHASVRTLKNLLQEQQVPPWRRDRLPLLYSGDQLVCVPGVAIAAEYQAGPDEDGVLLQLSG